MTKATRKAIRQLRAQGDGLDDVAEAAAAIAVNLAKKLDAGAGMATAAVARELRETLDALAPREDGDAEQSLLDQLGAHLSSPVQHSQN